MALKIRLQRGGARHKPFYRMVVADARAKRDGRFVEVVGTYDPTNQRKEEQIKIKLERADYWVGVGAQPTDTARTLINRARRECPETIEKAPAAAAPAPATPAAAEPAPAPAAAESAVPASEVSTTAAEPAAESEAPDLAAAEVASGTPDEEPVKES